MPELPEVHTTVTGLQKVLPKQKITDVWTSLNSKDKRNADSIKNPLFFKKFLKEVRGQAVLGVSRRAKNILIDLSNKKTILIHMKMTGHLLYGLYAFDSKKKEWLPNAKEKNEALRDPFNRHIRALFYLSNGKHPAFSDMRKFGKITLIPTETAHDSKHLFGLGPEPLEKTFTEKKFIERIILRPNGKIKQVLMDQSIIAGIGNIYSDEMLWLSGIHPVSKPSKIPSKLISLLYTSMGIVLKKGIDFGGDSTSDYRDIHGKHGNFQHAHNAYRKTGKPCPKKGCKGFIRRLIVATRSAHFCDVHQKLYA